MTAAEETIISYPRTKHLSLGLASGVATIANSRRHFIIRISDIMIASFLFFYSTVRVFLENCSSPINIASLCL